MDRTTGSILFLDWRCCRNARRKKLFPALRCFRPTRSGDPNAKKSWRRKDRIRSCLALPGSGPSVKIFPGLAVPTRSCPSRPAIRLVTCEEAVLATIEYIPLSCNSMMAPLFPVPSRIFPLDEKPIEKTSSSREVHSVSREPVGGNLHDLRAAGCGREQREGGGSLRVCGCLDC